MEAGGRERHLECAGRALAGALAGKDPKVVAVLLRLAAKHLEEVGEGQGISAGKRALALDHVRFDERT